MNVYRTKSKKYDKAPSWNLIYGYTLYSTYSKNEFDRIVYLYQTLCASLWHITEEIPNAKTKNERDQLISMKEIISTQEGEMRWMVNQRLEEYKNEHS